MVVSNAHWWQPLGETSLRVTTGGKGRGGRWRRICVYKPATFGAAAAAAGATDVCAWYRGVGTRLAVRVARFCLLCGTA